MSSDRVVLVTGAGSGMGRAIAQQFAKTGARIAALDMNADTVQQTVDGLEDAVAVVTDLRIRSEITRGVQEVLDTYGRIDVLCNNAGILDGYADAVNTTDELWDDIIATDLTAPFLMSRAVLPAMLEQSAGVIINTSSISGWVAAGGGTAYTAAKHGVVGLTKQLAYNFGSRGIRANAICPGAVMTEMTKDLVDDEHVSKMIEGTPAGRWAQPHEIADLAVYLASDQASFAHGSVFVMDGGWIVS